MASTNTNLCDFGSAILARSNANPRDPNPTVAPTAVVNRSKRDLKFEHHLDNGFIRILIEVPGATEDNCSIQWSDSSWDPVISVSSRGLSSGWVGTANLSSIRHYIDPSVVGSTRGISSVLDHGILSISIPRVPTSVVFEPLPLFPPKSS